jgi:hypothetical protein
MQAIALSIALLGWRSPAKLLLLPEESLNPNPTEANL